MHQLTPLWTGAVRSPDRVGKIVRIEVLVELDRWLFADIDRSKWKGR